MTTLDRSDTRPASPPRPSPLGRLTLGALRRTLPAIAGGTLAVTLPDGTRERFGEGDPEVDLHLESWKLLDRIATRPKMALGDSYQAGEWRSGDLVAMLELLLRNATAAGASHPWLRRFSELLPRMNRRTGILAAKRNIERHYDLGNELFSLFLDPTMTYSCAVFARDDEDLEAAQRRKLRSVCDKLELGPGDHVLEIGCGWGSFALTAAGEYGARVTALTISPSQAALARARARDAGLEGRVEIVERDFREIDGTFTKIASIEMLEAVGEKLWRPYFETCDRVLARGGRALVQTILVPDARFARYRSSPDWIERHIFPGCLIPSRGALSEALSRTSLRIRSDEEIGPHYATTLARWRARFFENLASVRALGYDDRFVRTWDFYLASCEALFASGMLHDAQLELAR